MQKIGYALASELKKLKEYKQVKVLYDKLNNSLRYLENAKSQFGIIKLNKEFRKLHSLETKVQFNPKNIKKGGFEFGILNEPRIMLEDD